MMINARIRLDTPLLGDKHTGAGVRRFSRADRRLERLPLEAKLWAWALSQSAEALRIPYSDDMVRVASSIRCPTLAMHARSYRKAAGGALKKELFESVRAGTVLEVQFMVFSKPAPDAAVSGIISVENFRRVLETTGSMVGVSPWGSKFGYGRFTVLDVSEEGALDVGTCGGACIPGQDDAE